MVVVKSKLSNVHCASDILGNFIESMSTSTWYHSCSHTVYKWHFLICIFLTDVWRLKASNLRFSFLNRSLLTDACRSERCDWCIYILTELHRNSMVNYYTWNCRSSERFRREGVETLFSLCHNYTSVPSNGIGRRCIQMSSVHEGMCCPFLWF